MNVTLPNGRVINGIPNGTSKDDIMKKAISAGMATFSDFGKQEKPKDTYKQQAKSDPVLQNTLAGIGGGMTSLYHGAKQAFGADNQAEIDEHRKAMEGLRSTTGGFVGDIVGQAALTAPVMAIPGANTYVGAAALGGALGGAQPTLEDESRLANIGMGTIGGASGKYVGDKIGKMLIGNPSAGLNKAEQHALNKGRELGFKQTPGYSSGSKGLQKLEARMESSPLFSRGIESVQDHNQTRMNQIAAKALGEESDTLDSSVLGTIKLKIGDVYKKVATDTQRAVDPDEALDSLVNIANKYENLLPGDLMDEGFVKEFFKMAERGQATGKQLQHLSSRVNRAAKNNMTTASGDRELGLALFDFKDVVDDHLQKSLSPKLSKEFADARSRYRTLIQLTKRNNVVNPSSGNVKPVALSNYLQQTDKPGFLFGGNQSDLYNAARFGQAFKPIVGDSGTATRSGQNFDIATLLSAPFTNTATKMYTSVPSQSMVGGLAKNGLLNLPEESLQYLNQLGLLGGAIGSSQQQGR